MNELLIIQENEFWRESSEYVKKLVLESTLFAGSNAYLWLERENARTHTESNK